MTNVTLFCPYYTLCFLDTFHDYGFLSHDRYVETGWHHYLLWSSLYDYQGQVASIVYLRLLLLSHLVDVQIKLAVTYNITAVKYCLLFQTVNRKSLFAIVISIRISSLVFGIASTGRQQSRALSLLSFFGDLAWISSCTYATPYELMSALWLVVQSLGTPKCPGQLTLLFYCGVLIHSGFPSPSCKSSTRLLELSPMFGASKKTVMLGSGL